MIFRSVDPSGDILPVLSSADLVSGPEGVAAGLWDHLNLFVGDWWEYADRGNEILELMALSRRTEQDAQTLSSCLRTYLQSFPAVRSLSDVHASFAGREFRFSCTVHTGTGEAVPLSFTLS